MTASQRRAVVAGASVAADGLMLAPKPRRAIEFARLGPSRAVTVGGGRRLFTEALGMATAA